MAADGLSVSEVRITNQSCLGQLVSFIAPLTPSTAPIQTGADGKRRFEARNIALPNSRTFGITGVLFDADAADLSHEQGVGGLSITVALGVCNTHWAATAEPDGDGDGWSDRGELRLGSNPSVFNQTPEHREIPSLLPLYVRPCDDLVDNDGDAAVDTANQGCA